MIQVCSDYPALCNKCTIKRFDCQRRAFHNGFRRSGWNRNREVENLITGCSRCEIVFPEGFFPTEGFVRQVHPLFVRSLVLGEKQPFVYVSVEMTSLPDEEVAVLRSAAAEAAETVQDRVWITVTHTFSAPHIRPDPSLRTEEDRERKHTLQHLLLQAVAASVREAVKNRREAELTLTQGESEIPGSRDIELADGWWVGCGGKGPADRTLTVLRWQAEDQPLAVLMHLNLQPSVLDGTGAAEGKCVSGDLAGRACAELEKRYPGATAFFMIGAAGDTAPVRKAKGFLPEEGGWREQDLHEAGVALAEELGDLLAAETAEIMRLPGVPLTGAPVPEEATVIVPAKKMNRNLHELKPTRSCVWEADGEMEQPVSVLALGELALVGVKPELTYITDQRIKRESPYPYTLVTTLVNGGAKYMADRSCYERFMYEAVNSPFAPGAAERLAQSAVTMLQAAAMN